MQIQRKFVLINQRLNLNQVDECERLGGWRKKAKKSLDRLNDCVADLIKTKQRTRSRVNDSEFKSILWPQTS